MAKLRAFAEGSEAVDCEGGLWCYKFFDVPLQTSQKSCRQASACVVHKFSHIKFPNQDCKCGLSDMRILGGADRSDELAEVSAIEIWPIV